jgi:hypothetical protein
MKMIDMILNTIIILGISFIGIGVLFNPHLDNELDDE